MKFNIKEWQEKHLLNEDMMMIFLQEKKKLMEVMWRAVGEIENTMEKSYAYSRHDKIKAKADKATKALRNLIKEVEKYKG